LKAKKKDMNNEQEKTSLWLPCPKHSTSAQHSKKTFYGLKERFIVKRFFNSHLRESC
jgi:hypothetical protein